MFATVQLPDSLVLAAVPIIVSGFAWLVNRLFTLQAQANAAVHEDATMDAKDELIETLESNHKALSQRVELLEDKATGLSGKLADANRREAELLARYEELSKYAAPEAVKAFTAMLETHASTTITLLDSLLVRMTEVERNTAAINGNTAALNEVVVALSKAA